MAAVFLGCGAIWSDRLKKRYETRKEDKKDYESRFEEFKAENERWEARRQSYRDGSYSSNSTELLSGMASTADQVSHTVHSARSTPGAVQAERLPSYDVATATAGSLRTSSASFRSTRSSSSVSTTSGGDARSTRPSIGSQRSTGANSAQYIAIGTRDLGPD
jgi:hypothetical protein